MTIDDNNQKQQQKDKDGNECASRATANDRTMNLNSGCDDKSKADAKKVSNPYILMRR